MNARRLILCSLFAPLAACIGNGGGLPSPGGDPVAVSNLPRQSAAGVPAADVAQQSHDDEGFAFGLYAQLAATPGNLFFSPYSISSALAMTWAGAAGTTATGMATALHFTLPAPRVGAAFNALDQALASRAASGGTGEDGGPFKLNVANALWGQSGFTFEAPFLDTLAQDYGAGVRLEDFIGAADPSRLAINAWVSQNTSGKIPDLLAPGTVTSATRLVLTNAVYFNASWATPFNTHQTAPADFHRADGSTVSVSMMNEMLQMARWAQGKGWQAVELPYSNPALTLTVIVPDDGQLANVEGQLGAAFFDGLVAAETSASVALGLPKFTVTTTLDLAAPLGNLGMGVAFSPQADFSGIDGAHDLSISGVIHQATVDVDEAGTEAAAATAVVVGIDAVLAPGVTLVIDRPFLVVLRDLPTGAVLFIGRIADPSNGAAVTPGGPAQGVACTSDNDCTFPMTACSSNCCSGLPPCATSCIDGTCQKPPGACTGPINCPAIPACQTTADCPVNAGAACAMVCNDGSNPCINACVSNVCVERGCPNG